MTQQDEQSFERLVPTHSLFGKEYHALKKERDKERKLFEVSPDKIAYDTRPYRRTEIALARYIEEWTPKIVAAKERIALAHEKLVLAEKKAQGPIHGIQMDRRSHRIIWTRFAIERYYLALPRAFRKTLRRSHPESLKTLYRAWKTFRTEMRRWQYGGQPFDGSQAMAAMFSFLNCAHQARAYGE